METAANKVLLKEARDATAAGLAYSDALFYNRNGGAAYVSPAEVMALKQARAMTPEGRAYRAALTTPSDEVKAAIETRKLARLERETAYEATHGPQPKGSTKAYAAMRRATPEAKAAKAALQRAPKAKATAAAYYARPERKAAKAALQKTPAARARMKIYNTAPAVKARNQTPKYKAMRRACVMRRTLAKAQRVPAWADLKAIRAFIAACPVGETIDHILPLRGKLISGLHVLNNLQYLTRSQNSVKRNKFEIV
jgi:hypothetical protein